MNICTFPNNSRKTPVSFVNSKYYRSFTFEVVVFYCVQLNYDMAWVYGTHFNIKCQKVIWKIKCQVNPKVKHLNVPLKRYKLVVKWMLHCDVTWASWRRKSTNRLFVQGIIQVVKEITQVHITVSLWRESIDGWWFLAQRSNNTECVSSLWRHHVI